MPLSLRSLAAFAVILPLVACSAASEPESFTSSADSIVGGSSASDEFPNVGYFSEGAEGGQFCTGTLIAPRVVLTAAHCFEGGNPGAYFTFGAIGSGNGYRVASVRNHPQYDQSFTKGYDIAYAVLERAANVAPAAVRAPTNGCGHVGVGYGRTTAGAPEAAGGMPDDKRKLELCAEPLATGWVSVTSDVGSTCFGDSGGPLFVRGMNTIVGVLSHGLSADGVSCKPGDESRYTTARGGLVDAFLDEALAAGGDAIESPGEDPGNAEEKGNDEPPPAEEEPPCEDRDGDGWCDEEPPCEDRDGDGWCDEEYDCEDQDGDGWCDE